MPTRFVVRGEPKSKLLFIEVESPFHFSNGSWPYQRMSAPFFRSTIVVITHASVMITRVSTLLSLPAKNAFHAKVNAIMFPGKDSQSMYPQAHIVSIGFIMVKISEATPTRRDLSPFVFIGPS